MTSVPATDRTSPIARTFAALKDRQRMAFMPFVTAGDPDLPTTIEVIRELAGRGVDLIEVGFPYSDPIADGPVIQASYTRALGRGFRVDELLEEFGKLASDHPPLRKGGPGGVARPPSDLNESSPSDAADLTCSERVAAIPPSPPLERGGESLLPPLVAMVSYAIILRRGRDRFLRDCRAAGFSGLIVPDLPGDVGQDVAAAARELELDLVQLISPTTPPERAARILDRASGFVYCISVAGTTGVRDRLPHELREQLRSLRNQTDLPLAVGFGISRPEQVDSLRGLADGIIVGSAIVRQLERFTDDAWQSAAVIESIGELASTMLAATGSGG